MTYENLLISYEDHIAIITINRPTSLNALNAKTISELEICLTRDTAIEKAAGIVITGAGEKAFVAGADIMEFSFESSEESRLLSKKGQDLFSLIEKNRVPIIAAVNGFALGGGFELCMACHLRVAGSHARFGQPEVNLGLIPGYGGTQRLIRYLGPTKAMEYLMTGAMIDAKEAEKLGLVNRVTDPGNEVRVSIELLRTILKKAPLAIEQIINCYNAYYDRNDGFVVENQAFASLMMTDDVREGVQAFRQKREPQFRGK